MPVAAEPNRLLERLDESDHTRRRAPLEHLIRAVKVGQPELQERETASPDAVGIFGARYRADLAPLGAIPVRPLCRRQRKMPFLWPGRAAEQFANASLPGGVRRFLALSGRFLRLKRASLSARYRHVSRSSCRLSRQIPPRKAKS